MENALTEEAEGPVTEDSLATKTAELVDGQPRNGLSLKRNFSWTAAGNTIYAVSQWAMISVLAKLGSTEIVGQFSLAVALTTPVFSLFNLQLRSIQATDAKGEFSFSAYLGLRYLTTLAALVVILTMGIRDTYSSSIVSVLLIMSLGRALDAVSDVFYGHFQYLERMDVIARAMMLNGLASVVALSVGFSVTQSLVAGVLGATVASALTLLYVVIQFREQGFSTFQPVLPDHAKHLAKMSVKMPAPSVLRRLFILALPMGVVMFVLSLNANVPRYVIAAFGSESQLGIFSALAYLLVAGTTVVAALGQSASPRLAKLFASGELDGFLSLLRKLTGIGFLLGLLGTALSYFAGRYILTMVYTAEYSEYEDILTILSLSAGFSFASSFMGYGMTAARKFKSQVPLFLMVGVVTFAFCILLIPRYGLIGAAWALVGSGTVSLLGSGLIVRNAVAERR